MTGSVIQGFFPSGRPRAGSHLVPAMTSNLAPSRMQPAGQARTVGRPTPAFAGPMEAAGPGSARPVQASGGNESFQVDPGKLGLAVHGGKPLPDEVRRQMETALGADFSNVRVHVGPQAERIGAVAFTTGSNIYFAPGRFQPDTVQGRQLLGHELAHVVQQRQGRVRGPTGAALAVVRDRALEAEADRLGHMAATHRPVAQAKAKPPTVQPSTPVRVSAPARAGDETYRLTAGAEGRQIGSVMVRPRNNESVEITDLGVHPAHRDQGVGKRLVAAAARAGLQSGRSRVVLSAQDDGSGRLTKWYRSMGFHQAGVGPRGYPLLAAPAHTVLGRADQRLAPIGGVVTPDHRRSAVDRTHGPPIQAMITSPFGMPDLFAGWRAGLAAPVAPPVAPPPAIVAPAPAAVAPAPAAAAPAVVAPALAETSFTEGFLSGRNGAYWAHISFSDGTKMSFKRNSNTLRWVYMDVRAGVDSGAGFSVYNEGYTGQEVKHWISANYPNLAPHWAIFRRNHPR